VTYLLVGNKLAPRKELSLLLSEVPTNKASRRPVLRAAIQPRETPYMSCCWWIALPWRAWPSRFEAFCWLQQRVAGSPLQFSPNLLLRVVNPGHYMPSRELW